MYHYVKNHWSYIRRWYPAICSSLPDNMSISRFRLVRISSPPLLFEHTIIFKGMEKGTF